MRSLILFLAFAPLAASQSRTLPRHLLSTPEAPLTEPSHATPLAIAEQYVRAVARDAGLADTDLAGLYVVKEYRSDHNGVTHLYYRQQFSGADVYGSGWSVNIAADGSVLNAGGRLFPAPGAGVLPPDALTAMRAVRTAAAAVSPKLAGRFAPFAAPGAKSARAAVFHRGPFAEEIEGETVWFPINGTLRPAWKFLIADEDQTLYEVVADSDSDALFSRRAMTFFQSPQAPRGLVYTGESPQPNPSPGKPLTTPPPYLPRTLVSFAGDPVASPNGWVSGNETAGNNTVTGENTAGANFITNPRTAVSANRDFSFPLEAGPGAPSPMNYADAVTTNLFYWINRAHDQFYADGFDEKSGNFQQLNFGRGGVDGDRLPAYTHFGSAQPGSPLLNNSSFSSRSFDDGSAVALRMYLATFPGTFFTDGALDSGVIVHEFTHGVSGRLAAQVYYTFQGAAMGEAWSDFFGAEYTLPAGAPADGSYPIGEYFTQAFGAGIRTRPYSTNFDVNPLTFAQLGRVISYPEVHADGEIWMQALWEMRGALIRQFGDAEGRRRTRLLIIDGMKLEPPQATMVDARDAILLADRVDFKGASQDQLWEAFGKRGLGVLARSSSGNTVHVLASFEKPSPRASMRFYDDPVVLGETVTLVLQDANATAPAVGVQLLTGGGDKETLLLRKQGSVYVGSMNTSGSASAVTQNNGSLQLVSSDAITAYYLDVDTGAGAEQVTASTATQPDFSLSASTAAYKFGDETPLFPTTSTFSGTYTSYNLPFSFPFYGNVYQRVQVHTGGAISFGLPVDGFPCADRASFAEFTAIAPLFAELRLGGTAQKDENIYVSRPAADQVTFRWAAETISAPTPVNFAATLYADGRILYQYGTGNQNLGNVASVYGCASAGPVVGVSPGHDSYRATVSIRNLENATPLLWTPPVNATTAPQVIVESPAEGTHVKTALTVSGIAYDTGEAITRIDIFIDGVARGRTTASVSRPDYCAGDSQPGCPRVGFSATLGVAALGLARGPHTLQLLVTNARGATVAAPGESRTFIVDEGADSLPVVTLEKPAAGTVLTGTVILSGFAYDPLYRISAIDLVVDGLTYGQVTYGQARTDICTPLKNVPNCPGVGFTMALNTVSGTILMPNGDHKLQFRVRDSIGRSLLVPDEGIAVTVNNDPRPTPVLVVESPAPNAKVSGTFQVTGYAYVPDGKIASVRVVIDESTYATVPANLERADVCASLPGAACPNVGFRATIDSRLLGNGVHALRVIATSDKGVRVAVPSVFSGQNLYVEN